MLAIWQIQIAGLAFLAVLSNIVERRAAMRGCKTQAMPAWMDKSLRIAFLGVVAGPSMVAIDMIIGFPVLSIILVLYMVPYSDLCEQRGGWKNLYTRRSFGRIMGYFRERLGIKLVKSQDLDPKEKYIFGIHPHSVLPFGAIIGCNDETDENCFKNLFPGIEVRTLAATFCFYVPLYRDALLGFGVVDAARYSAKYILGAGYSLALVPGGATEALYCNEDKDVVYLKKRAGFIKLALETGSSLVPVFSFNECNAYGVLGVNSPTINAFKTKFQAIFGISLPLVTNIMPKRTKITVMFGEPLKCPKTESPTKEQVVEYLDKYAQSLTKLYEDNAERYNIKEKPALAII